MTHQDGLENRRSGNATVGSNPTLSADFCDFTGEEGLAHSAPFTPRSTHPDGAQVGTDDPWARYRTGKMVPDGKGGLVEQIVVPGPRAFDAPALRSAPAYATIYFIGPESGPIKIGYTVNVTLRLRDLRLANALPLKLWASIHGPTKLEREYHRRFAAHRLHGEWFERHPDILAEIDRLNSEGSTLRARIGGQ